MIGDPSGKSAERNLLDSETLYHNQECIKAQVAKFLDFDAKGDNAAEMVNGEAAAAEATDRQAEEGPAS